MKNLDRMMAPALLPDARLPAYLSKVLSYRRQADNF